MTIGSKKKIVYGLSMLLTLALSKPAASQAGTATASIVVTATVLSSCSITASPLAFGNYSQVVLNATTTVSVTCTNGTPYTVGLDAGTGTGATVAARKMTLSSTTLTYSLYSDAGRSTVWGNTIGTNTVAGTANGSAQSITVYGQIPANQTVNPGNYTDTVTATVNY